MKLKWIKKEENKLLKIGNYIFGCTRNMLYICSVIK